MFHYFFFCKLGKARYSGNSSTSPSTNKSPWQQKSSTSSMYRSISEEDTDPKKSVYYTPPSTPTTPLPYKTPPTSPLDIKRSQGFPSGPMASSTPASESKTPSPVTAAQMKRQFLFGSNYSEDGEVFMADTGKKDEVSQNKIKIK